MAKCFSVELKLSPPIPLWQCESWLALTKVRQFHQLTALRRIASTSCFESNLSFKLQTMNLWEASFGTYEYTYSTLLNPNGSQKVSSCGKPVVVQPVYGFIGIPWKADIVTFIFNSVLDSVVLSLGLWAFLHVWWPPWLLRGHVLQDDKTPHIFFTESFWHKMEKRFIPRGLQHLLCCPLKVLCLLWLSHDRVHQGQT